MKSKLHHLPFALMGILMLTCQLQEAMSQSVVDRIALKPGPEDMVLDTLHGEPALLISCCERREEDKTFGEMIRLNLLTEEQLIMERLNEPAEILFRPHGIYLDGDLLYVISHEKEPNDHPVLIYRVEGSQLHFVDLIRTPLHYNYRLHATKTFLISAILLHRFANIHYKLSPKNDMGC